MVVVDMAHTSVRVQFERVELCHEAASGRVLLGLDAERAAGLGLEDAQNGAGLGHRQATRGCTQDRTPSCACAPTLPAGVRP